MAGMVGLCRGEEELGKVSRKTSKWEIWRLWSTKRSRENVLVCPGVGHTGS